MNIASLTVTDVDDHIAALTQNLNKIQTSLIYCTEQARRPENIDRATIIQSRIDELEMMSSLAPIYIDSYQDVSVIVDQNHHLDMPEEVEISLMRLLKRVVAFNRHSDSLFPT